MAAQTYSRPASGSATEAMYRPDRALADVRPFGRSLLSWSGILAAGVIAVGLLFLATSFWNALAFTNGYVWYADHLVWLDAGTAAGVMLIGGVLAGWFSHRGMVAGIANALTVWGLLVTGAVLLGLGSAVPLTIVTETARPVANAPLPGSFWPTFIAYGIGFVAAAAGGLVGSLIPEPSTMLAPAVIDLREEPAMAVPARSTRGATTTQAPPEAAEFLADH